MNLLPTLATIAFIFTTNANAQELFCPEQTLDFTIKVYPEASIIIQNPSWGAFCVIDKADKYACIPTYGEHRSPDGFFIHANILSNGLLSIVPPEDESKPLLSAPCPKS